MQKKLLEDSILAMQLGVELVSTQMQDVLVYATL